MSSLSGGRMSLANLLSSSPPSPAAKEHDAMPSPHETDMDESELIAAAALRGMRAASLAGSAQATPALSLASSTSYSTLSDAVPRRYNVGSSRASSSRRGLDDDDGEDAGSVLLDDEDGVVDEEYLAESGAVDSQDFVSRVSRVPLVNSALRVYDYSKNSSRVVKYAAQTVESSVSRISKPVIDRLPVNSLDEFACRQLDRWTPKGKASPTPTPSDGMLLDPADRSKSPEADRGRSVDRAPRGARRRTDSAMSASPAPPLSQLTIPQRGDAAGTSHDAATANASTSTQLQHDQLVARSTSTWQAVITEAGGISAAVSEESMKRLKYCLSWLQYATARIDHQILVLREFIQSVNAAQAQTQNQDAVVSPAHLRALHNVKQDVVQTIRDVVDVVSKYAGGALPEPARATVRAFILHLPQRWAVRMQGAPGAASLPVTPGVQGQSAPDPTAELASPTSPSTGGPPTANHTSAAAHRILTLATESLDMMRSVTGVFKDSFDRAETWVERLRVVGIQRPVLDASGAPVPGAAYRSAPPSEAGGDLTDIEHESESAPSPVGLSPNPSSTGSIGLGVSLGALSLAALQHQQALERQQRLQAANGAAAAGGPRFTLGPPAGSGMDVDDD